jgi:quercetin dioxygenase-like cupin family protein
VKRFNLYGDEWEREQERKGYRWRAQTIGPVLGATMLGATVYELPPGQKSFPYHYEYGTEEWLLVVAGRPTLRTPEGEQELEAGDVVCFPEGPDGAHQGAERDGGAGANSRVLDEAVAGGRGVSRQRQARHLDHRERRLAHRAARFRSRLLGGRVANGDSHSDSHSDCHWVVPEPLRMGTGFSCAVGAALRSERYATTST